MKLEIHKLLEKVLKEESEKENETITEDGQIAAPATDTSATNDSLPVPPLVVIRRPKYVKTKINEEK